MSALDDSVAANLVHAAGSGADPLTDSLCDQAAPYSLREGWETEAIAVPLPWLLGLLALLVGCFVLPSLVGNAYHQNNPLRSTQAQAHSAANLAANSPASAVGAPR